MKLNELIANKVKERRLLAGWSQGVLAYKSGVTMRTIQNIESGKSASPKILEKLFKPLGIEMLLNEIDVDE